MLDCPRRWNGGEGRSQQVAKRRRDRLILHALLPQRSKPEGRSGRPAERGRETRDDLVSEEDSLDGNGCEVLKVSRALLGDENDGQERMLSLDVSQDAENGWEIWSFEYDCVSVTGKPPQFLLVAGQDTSAVVGDCYRPCKIAQKWPSKMSHVGRVTERWLRRGVRVSTRVPGGFHTMASPPNGGDAMIGRETRVLLRHYLEQGMSKAAIARQVGINPRTVYRWIAAGQLDRELDDGAVRYGPRPSRPSKLDPYRGIIDTRLAEYPELSAVRLFNEVQAAGYPGGYGQVKRYVREVRPRPPEEPVQRFETPPGHQAQVDFAEFRLPWGKRYALIVVLGYSRRMWVQYYERQTMAVVMRGLESAFRYFRGVPSELLFDQMKAVIIEDGRGKGGRLVENREFLRFSVHWGFRIRACRPYRAQTKGKVERLVSYIRKNFFYGRVFGSDDDLNAQVLLWLDTEANVRIHGTLKERPADRFEAERSHLMPLPPWPYRSVAPRPVEPAPERAEGAAFPPLVEVERRPLAEYARIAGGAP